MALPLPARASRALLMLVAAALLLAAPAQAAAASGLARAIESAWRTERKALPKEALVQGVVRRLSDGEVVWQQGDGQPINLASVTKVVTAAAALDTHGPDHVFTTRVHLVGATGDKAARVVLEAGGDPTLREADLDALAAAVADHGVLRVDHLSVVPAPYGPAAFPPYFQRKQTMASYRAPVGGLNLDRNRLRIRLVPGAKPGAPVQVRLHPSADGATLENRGTTIAGKAERLKVDVRWPAGAAPVVVVRGEMGVRRKAGVTAVLLNQHPERWAAETFRTLLARRGVVVAAAPTVDGAVPAGATEVGSHRSDTLTDVVADMLARSDNQIAEALLLAMAPRGAGSFPAGVAATRAWLQGNDAGDDEIAIHNGSGLYHGGFGSALAFTRLLVRLRQRQGVGDHLFDGLAAPGREGTLQRRLRDLGAERVRAKTGTLNEVSALCGYAVPDGSGGYAFCVLADALEKRHLGRARALQDAVVRAIFEGQPKARPAARPSVGASSPAVGASSKEARR